MLKLKKQTVYELGILLSLLGIPISSVINEYLQGRFEITNVLLFVSLAMVADWKRLLAFKLRMNNGVIMILAYQIYVIALEFLAGQALFETASGMIYTLFMVVILIFACSRRHLEDPDHFIHTVWLTLGIFNIATTFLITNGFSSFAISRRTVMEYGADRLTLSKLGFAFLIAQLAYGKSNNSKKHFLMIGFLISTVYNLIYCNRRATLVYFIIILALHYLYYEERRIKVQPKKIFNWIGLAVAVTLVACISIKYIPNLQESVSSYLQSIQNAFQTFFGKANADEAASIRNSLRAKAFHWLKTSNPVQLMFGRGYMFEYLDFPILQAIIDMGIFGLFYFFIQMIYPLKYLRVKNTNAAECFFQYLVILYYFDNIFAGIPYGYGKFVPLLYLFLQVRTVRNKVECGC